MPIITIGSRSGIKATINSAGAELTSITANDKLEYIWSADPDFWGKSSPVLFPIVVTIRNNLFIYNKVAYVMGRHGFAREMEFSVAEKTENSARFVLASSSETRKQYPFDFVLTILYTISANILAIDYTITNHSDTKMPFKIGAHPAFALPGNFDDYQLEFPADTNLECYQLQDGLLTDRISNVPIDQNRLNLTYNLFEKDALVLKALNSKSVAILKDGVPRLNVHLHNFPNLGIWTKPGASFICIEPWFGYSDPIDAPENLERKSGFQVLNPQTTFDCRFRIEIL